MVVSFPDRYTVLLRVWEQDYTLMVYGRLSMDLNEDLLFLQYVHTYNKLNHVCSYVMPSLWIVHLYLGWLYLQSKA